MATQRAIQSYEVYDDAGTTRMRFINSTPQDEVHTGAVTGWINVSAIWRDIALGKARAKARACEIDARVNGIRACLRNADIDKVRLAQITPGRAQHPGILIALNGGTHAIIDGTHRLAWLINNGGTEFRFWEIAESDVAPYVVQVLIKKPGVDWRILGAQESLDDSRGTYPVLDENGRMVGMRDERQAVR